MNNFPFFNQQPVEQVAIKKLPNPQNYKIVKCKNFETTGIIQTKKGNCKYREYCTFAHGETELRTKNENTFMVTNNNTNTNNSNQFNYNNPQMQMYLPQQQFAGNFAGNFPGNPPEWSGDFNQLYNYQGGYPFPMQMQGNDNMTINPNNINLNMNSNLGVNINNGINPHMSGNYGLNSDNYMQNMQK